MPCLSYTVHLTLYTPYTESKNIFFIFVRDEIPHFRFISFYSAQRFYLLLFTIFPPACVPYLYTREAYTPLGI